MSVATPTPECFKATVVTTRSGVQYCYQNLKEHTLTPEEKLWLCREVDGQKNGTRDDQCTSKKGLLRRYSISLGFFKNNYETYKLYGHFRKLGRPAFIDQSSISNIKQTIFKRTYEKNEMTVSELVKLCNEEQKETKRRRIDEKFESKKKRRKNVKLLCEPCQDVDTRTVMKLIKNENLLQRKIDFHVTKARDDACKCPFISYMWYLVCLAFSEHLPSTNKWNADGTTYVFCSSETKKEKIVRLCEEDEVKLVTDVEIELAERSGGKICKQKGHTRRGGGKVLCADNRLPFAIKCMQMSSAAGECSPFVAVVSVPNFSETDWHVERIIGLSSRNASDVGYVYFSRNRCGNEDMWAHYFKNIVVPTIKESSERHQSRDRDGNICRQFFSTDGEAIIMKNAYKDDVVDVFEEAKMDYLRVGAGSTGIHNACDRSKGFRNSKSTMGKMQQKKMDYSNTTLENALRKGYANMAERYPNLEIPIAQINNAIEGILIIIRAYESTMTPTAIREGFRVSGQDCIPAFEGGPTIDFERIMFQCYSDIPRAQLDLMYEKGPFFANILKLEGQVTYDQLVSEGITPGTTTIKRDDLTWVRHWSEVVNHKQTVARYREQLARKDPERIQLQKQENNDNRIILQASLKEARIQSKLAAQEREKERRRNLTPEEKNQEDEMKNQIKAAKAAQKLAQEAAMKKTVDDAKERQAQRLARAVPATTNNAMEYTV